MHFADETRIVDTDRVSCFQVKNADIVVSAIGKAQFVQGSWLKPGAVVIDVGTNYIPGQSGIVASAISH